MRIEATTQPIRSQATAPVAGPAGGAAPAAIAADYFAATQPAVPPGVTVDIRGHVDAGAALAATGTVSLDRTFMERLVRHVTRKPAFTHRDVRFDPASQTYRGAVHVKVKGIKLKLVGQVVPVADAGLPAFQFKDLGLKVGPFTIRWGWVQRLATRLIANEITDGGVKATAAPNHTIRLDPTTLLQDADVLPYGFRVDTAKTKFAVKLDANGDVRIKATSDQAAPPPDASPRSDLALTLAQAALARLLEPMLSPDYELKGVTVGQDRITLDGRVEAKPLSDALNVGKGLLAIIVAANGGHVGDVSAERAMIGLKLDARLDGTQVVLTPSLRQAVGELEKTLKQAGLSPVRDKTSLRFDIAALLAPYGVKAVRAIDGRVEADVSLDINTLFKAPILRGEK